MLYCVEFHCNAKQKEGKIDHFSIHLSQFIGGHCFQVFRQLGGGDRLNNQIQSVLNTFPLPIYRTL